MKLTRILLAMLIALAVFTGCSEPDDPTMRSMVERLIPDHAHNFRFETIDSEKDVFELESEGSTIVVRGNNPNSMAVGLNHYLKYYCKTTVSWYLSDPIEMPKVLPAVDEKISIEARCDNRFFLNYCTFGYTMPWWQWKEWERFIDWMALNGVNMPLAITGQESIWYRIWKKHGMSDEEIREYFTGPAFLAWHRMSNIDQWEGPLPMRWLDEQEDLQKQIVAREREFNMKPVLPAFAGHVPEKLRDLYPDAHITKLSQWNKFDDKYRSSFLDPMDPLFATLQKEYLEEQTKLFGTDHIYGADPFNEVDPPSWEPDSLNYFSKNIYKTIEAADTDAIWFQMSWIFFHDKKHWTAPRLKAFLEGVPQGKMLLLDYYCERHEVWKETDAFYKQPYLWCYLGNFGGNTMIAGNLEETGKRIENVFQNGGDNFWGLGCTLEGFDVNQFMYEYVLEKAWNLDVDDTKWIESHADRRLGYADEKTREAWRLMYDSIYTREARTRQTTLVNSRPNFEGRGEPLTKAYYPYDNKTLLQVWDALIQVKGPTNNAYIYDIVNVGRQTIGNYFMDVRNDFTAAYKKRDLVKMKEKGDEMMEIIADMDLLLASHKNFKLSTWISEARALGGENKDLQDYYECNARILITVWGDRQSTLTDYANRSWSGITSSYYAPRWQMFIDKATECVKTGTKFDEKAFLAQLQDFEHGWARSLDKINEPVVEKPFENVSNIFNKYKERIANRK